MGVSIKDLARMANVSPTTVVRALKEMPDIKDETRQKIMELAKKHHYRPNALARSLVTNRTYTVGIVVPDLTNPFYPALIKGAEAALWQEGYNVILADTNYDPEKEIQCVNEFISRRVDGILIGPVDTGRDCYWYDSIRGNRIPAVSITKLEDLQLDTVIAADADGSFQAFSHLMENNRRHIVYMGNAEGGWASREREAGFRRALSTHDRQYDEHYVAQSPDGSFESAQAVMQNLLESRMEIDAVVAFDDMMALGIIRAVEEAGLRIPDDIAVVGFDNIKLAALPAVSLTTVDIPKYKIGEQAAALLLQRVEEKANDREPDPAVMTDFREIVLKPELIVRKTSRPAMPRS